MRKLKRMLARERMRKRGITHINKKIGKKHSSYFADHWREYIK
jgi:hypothetical protein